MTELTRDSVDAAIREKAGRELTSALRELALILDGCGASLEEKLRATVAFGPLVKMLKAGATPPQPPTYGWRCVCGHEAETREEMLRGHGRGLRCHEYRAALSDKPRAAPLKAVSMPSRDLLDIDEKYDSEKR